MDNERSAAIEPYSEQSELIDWFSVLLDNRVYLLYRYHSWVGPDNRLQNMIGVAVSREEFESNLSRAADSVCFSQIDENEREQAEAYADYFAAKFNAGSDFPVNRLCTAFGLDDFQLRVVMTLLCCELNRKYEKLFAYLQDDITKKYPSAEMLIRLMGKPFDRVSDYYRYFGEDSTLGRYICRSSGELSSAVRLSPQILRFLTGGGIGSAYEYWDCSSELHPLYTDEDIAENVQGALKTSVKDKTAVVCFTGGAGSGRRFQVKHCAKTLGENVLFVSAADICAAESAEDAFDDAVRERVLRGCALCVTDFEQLLEEGRESRLALISSLIRRSSDKLGGRLYITSEKKWLDARIGENCVKLDFELEETTERSRRALWAAFTAGKKFTDDVNADEMAAKFRFSAGQIKAAAERAEVLAEMAGEEAISAETLHDCCYAQVTSGLDTLASPIKPAYDWEDLVLPEHELKLLKEACMHVKYRHKVYAEWGFDKKAAYGRGLSVLMSGPPGTGKTMAAQVITKQLRMKLYKIQLSQVVSKYIGETEKNLRRVFVEAKSANCILFFDEMDALFGKRSEVKDSHDRNANVETAFLLQQLEEYDGVILMATNLLQNIDEAFMRRIGYVVSFPFPDPDTRERLWRKLLDTGAPLDDGVDYRFLAENFKIAGGNIKNCAVNAAFLAAADGSPISMKHLIPAVVNEQRKNNIVVLREDLKEYADLVFGVG